MTRKETLISEQNELEDQIVKIAENKNLSNENLEPILDGIADDMVDDYLSSELKVAWVLKEPYDDFEDGKPSGGGWSLPKDAFTKEDTWRNPVWQKIAYVMYGFNNGLSWNKMEWIRDNPSMIKEIRKVAWINVCKMPAQTASNDTLIAKGYNNVWRDIILKQLEIYNPDVIIFGKTYHCFANDPQGNIYKNAEKDNDISNELNKDNNRFPLSYMRLGKRILIDAYHPGRKGGAYVDSLIRALQKAKQELR